MLKLNGKILGVANLSFEYLPNEVTGLANFGQSEEAVNLFTFFLRGHNASAAESGELNGNVGHGNAKFSLQAGNSVRMLGEEIEDAKPRGIRESLADAYLPFVEGFFAVRGTRSTAFDLL